MKITLSYLVMSFLLISCGSDSGNSNSGFQSPYDPCLEGGACSSIRSVSKMEALNSYLDSMKNNSIAVGNTISSTEGTTIFMLDHASKTEVACFITDDLQRTIVEFDNKYFYVQEYRENPVVIPDTDTCKNAIYTPDYNKVSYAKENRLDMETINMTDVENFTFEKLNYKGRSALRISGTDNFEYDDGNGKTVKGTYKVFSLIDLNKNFFNQTIAEHYISTDDSGRFPMEDYVIDTKLSNRVRDVADVDVSTMDPSQIEDRTYQDK